MPSLKMKQTMKQTLITLVSGEAINNSLNKEQSLDENQKITICISTNFVPTKAKIKYNKILVCEIIPFM